MLTLARLSSYQCRYCFLTSDVVRPLNLMVSILAMSSSPVHCQDLNGHPRKRPRSIGGSFSGTPTLPGRLFIDSHGILSLSSYAKDPSAEVFVWDRNL